MRQFFINLRPSGDARLTSSEDIPVTGLGDEALPGFKATAAVAGHRFRSFQYFWRARNLVAYAGSSDVLADFNEQTALDLAKKLDFRATQGAK